MNRLQHSAAGYRRRLQIGTADVVVLVEGKTDRYLYSKLFFTICRDRGVGLAVRTAKELPAQAGGKKALLAYFQYLRRRQGLVSELDGKKTLVALMMDKDVDDLCRKVIRSPHVQYTEFYDSENYLYIHGDIVDAAAAASGLEPAAVQRVIGNAASWRLRAQQEWLLWTQVCVFAVTRKLRRGGNYGIPSSPINDRPYGGVIEAQLAARLAAMEGEYGRGRRSFERAWKRVGLFVRRLITSGQGDRVFKGKWYTWFLIHELTTVAAGREASLSGLDTRLPLHLAQTIDFGGAWSQRLRDWLDGLIAGAGFSSSDN